MGHTTGRRLRGTTSTEVVPAFVEPEAQAFSHNRIIAGYRAPHVSASSSNATRAADSFGAV